jgi:hypothetical protein
MGTPYRDDGAASGEGGAARAGQGQPGVMTAEIQFRYRTRCLTWVIREKFQFCRWWQRERRSCGDSRQLASSGRCGTGAGAKSQAYSEPEIQRHALQQF